VASSASARRGTAQAEPGAAATDWVVDAYRTYFRYVWALLGRLGVPAASIEDVAQEVFLVLHRRRHEFKNESSVRTWLHGIALHTARRHRQRIRRAEQPPPDLPGPGEPRSPEAAASDTQHLELLDRLLDALGDEQREVFVLAEIAELPVPEIATLIGVNLNTVYSRLRLARARVRETLTRVRDDEARRAARGGADGRSRS
jgi:RNA polymerase sigma-70 factor (ECF subfamily)